jgi:hypothetical protein
MKITLMAGIGLISLAPVLLAQDFDFKMLDKLSEHAKSSTNISLDEDSLVMVSKIFASQHGKDGEQLQSILKNLNGIYIRSYDFDKPGQYSEAELAPLRAYLKRPGWKPVLDVHEDKEWTQIYLLTLAGNKMGGMALVSTEPTSLTVVYINGELDLADLQKLSDDMGLDFNVRGLAGSKAGAGKMTDNKSKTAK